MSQIEDLRGVYVPQSEEELRKIQKKTEGLEKSVRSWAEETIRIIPRELPLITEEVKILALFVAQQHRVNLEIDGKTGGKSLPIPRQKLPPEAFATVHRNVAARLDSDLSRAVQSYCKDHDIDPNSPAVLDWRVAIRFLGQSIYSRIVEVDAPKKMLTSPRRFELSLVARDFSLNVENKRHEMLEAASPSLSH